MMGGKQIINFGERCSWGNLAHEFMHALGFFHEHTRSDRDSYVTIQWDNIKKYSEETGQNWEHNFYKCTERGCNDLKVGYDYGSIMHYGGYLGSYQTIVPKESGARIGQRQSLSAKDLIGINEHYGCTTNTTSTDVGLPSFAGWCRYGSNERDHIKYITINGALSCKQQCLDTEACSAFSYQPEVKNNCNLYQGGPYTKGDGRAGTTCYIMPKEEICIDVNVFTKAYGYENSWTFGKCSSTKKYPDGATTPERCCQPAGVYEVVCKCSYGDGWHGGYLEIGGEKYCNEFLDGEEKKENATMSMGNVCKEINIVTKNWGKENSWTLGNCSSAEEYTNHKQFTEECCQPAGNYNLVCKDTHRDGWHGGYIKIDGKDYCKTFTTGREQIEEVTF